MVVATIKYAIRLSCDRNSLYTNTYCPTGASSSATVRSERHVFLSVIPPTSFPRNTFLLSSTTTPWPSC